MKLPASVLYLAAAIGLEVVGTLSLKAASARWTPPLSVTVLAAYAGAFYCLSLALRSIPLGIAYAVWSGAGTVLVACAGVIVLRQKLDGMSLLGIALIVAGIAALSARKA